MRKSARIAALVAGPIMVLGIGAATAAPAFASTGTGSNAVGTKMTGQGKISYIDPVFGGVKCNETHHAGTNFDTVGCTFGTFAINTDGSLGAFTPTPRLDIAGQSSVVGWNSDFQNSGEPQGNLTYTVALDGSGYTGAAQY